MYHSAFNSVNLSLVALVGAVHIDNPIGPAHSSVCDRKLSRAARQILKTHAVPVLVNFLNVEYDGVKIPQNFAISAKLDDPIINDLGHGSRQMLGVDVLSISLIRTLNLVTEKRKEIDKGNSKKDDNRKEDTNLCPLDPKLDVYSFHELSQKDVTHRYQNIHNKNNKFSRLRCTICGKTFVSRYYLDLHFDNKHSSELGVLHTGGALETNATNSTLNGNQNNGLTRNSRNWICPGTTWCWALGGVSACDEVANLSEPHYHRGSSSNEMMKMSEEAEVEPCIPANLHLSNERCASLMESCFSPFSDLVQDLIFHVCLPLNESCESIQRRRMISEASVLVISPEKLAPKSWIAFVLHILKFPFIACIVTFGILFCIDFVQTGEVVSEKRE